MKRTRQLLATAATSLLLITACGDDGESSSTSQAAATTVADAATTTASKYPLTIQSCNEDVTFDKQPEKVLTTSSLGVEYMVAAGAVDKISQRSGEYGQGLRGAAAASEGIPVLSDEEPSLEVILGTEADMTFGYGINTTTRADLAKNGIASFIPSFNCGNEGSGNVGTPIEGLGAIDSIYEDLSVLGTIFGTEDIAAASIETIKSSIATTADGFDPGEFKTAMGVIFYGTDIYAFGAKGIVNEEIELLGLTNVVTEAEPYVTLPVESLIALNPEIIILSRTVVGDAMQTPEETIAAFMAFPGVDAMDAVVNGRIVTILPFDTDPNPSVHESFQSIAEQITALKP